MQLGALPALSREGPSPPAEKSPVLVPVHGPSSRLPLTLQGLPSTVCSSNSFPTSNWISVVRTGVEVLMLKDDASCLISTSDLEAAADANWRCIMPTPGRRWGRDEPFPEGPWPRFGPQTVLGRGQ